MVEIFKSKVRNVGTSLGILIPKEIIGNEKIKEGEEIEVAILKKNLELIEKLFGSAKGAKFKFQRDHTDRI